MNLTELRERYHDGTIKTKGRSEIMAKFMADFGYTSPEPMRKLLLIGSDIKPTPDQFLWLKNTIGYYYDYYSQTEPETATPSC